MESRGGLKRRIAGAVRAGLSLAGLPLAARALNRSNPLVVMYHGVVPDGRPYRNWGQLAESEFRRQLEHLARRYRVMPLREIVEAIRDGRTPPPHAAAITFDDGFANNARVAWPHLHALGLPATIFLVTGVVGTGRLLWPDEVFLLLWHAARGPGDRFAPPDPRLGRRYRRLVARLKLLPAGEKDAALQALRDASPVSATASPWADDFRLMTWDEARQLRQSGLIELGAHTVRHDILTRLPADEAYREIAESIATVRGQLGASEVAFAFPNGEPADFSPAIVDMVRDAGASCALTTVDGRNPPGTDVFAMRRIAVGSDLNQRAFRMRCTGLTAAMRQWLQRGGRSAATGDDAPAADRLTSEAPARRAETPGVARA